MPDARLGGLSRILIVGVNWLGDALLLTPSIRAVRNAFPQARIECLVPERIRAVYARNPHLNGVLTYDERASIASPSFWRTVLQLRAKRFDAALLFHGSRTKARMVHWAGIPERWGTERKGVGSLLTRTVPAAAPGTHRAQGYLDIVRALGIAENGRQIDFFPDPAVEISLKELLRRHGVDSEQDYAAVHAGGNWELKRWPVERFRQWLQLFLEQHENAKVVFCGSAGERETAMHIADGFDAGRVAVLAGKTSLDELALLFRKARFVLSNDSGPLHLAASQNTRLVGLFGPTSPAQTGPWTATAAEILWRDPGCEIPCYFRSCDRRVCMERLTAERVLRACNEVVAA